MTTGSAIAGPTPTASTALGLPRLVVAGARGRLGRVLLARALAQGFPVVGTVEGAPRPTSLAGPHVESVTPTHLRLLLPGADVFLTATTPRAERANLPAVARSGVAAVVATTGLADPPPPWLRACAERIPIVLDSNFSLGMAFLRASVRSIGPLPEGFDVSIVETHRRGKVDHPSGSARSLATDLARSGMRGWHRAAGRRIPSRVEIASVRGGETPGMHLVQIAGPSEILRLEHIAYGREAFAEGMLRSARWLSSGGTRPPAGLYSLKDVLAGGTP
jgi:4-hydroxy-tetrahydrodipicolinate reductase